MGKAAVLEKGGATLRTLEGQMAFLRIEPVSGICEGINPYVEPTPFELVTPEGVVVRSEGALGMARVAVKAGDGMLWVDYALPGPEGCPGLVLLQAEQPDLFRAGVDVKTLRAQSCRALLVEGMEGQPKVILNGEPLAEPIARFSNGQKTWYRVPIAPEN